MKPSRYLICLLLLCGLTLLPALVLNLLLLNNEGDIEGISFAASDWQQKTQGITFTPIMGNNALFKRLRLNDRLEQTDTIVFSSSTMMPIDGDMLPGRKLYNFAQSGQGLVSSIAQGEYILAHAPQVRGFVIAVDWSLGFIYQPFSGGMADLSPLRRGMLPPAKTRSLPALLAEAMSFPRMANLWQVLKNIGSSKQPWRAFHENFLQASSDEYLCRDGKTLGKDFGIQGRSHCNGFRADGSATYWGYPQAGDAGVLTAAALASDSKYVAALKQTQGAINPALFEQLARLQSRIRMAGGELLLIMPPLSPGLEKAMLQHPVYSAYLQRSKRDLAEWAKKHNALLADWGQSEQFGCTANEFLDQHHAHPPCFRKAFAAYWKTPEGVSFISRSERRR